MLAGGGVGRNSFAEDDPQAEPRAWALAGLVTSLAVLLGTRREGAHAWR